ncbi:MAG: thiazole biosynthesis adenylyltransferase ThiF, partial [Acidobacteriia bacterium]|nr:thiazole biosynthesis adenylyltransferase ThiF [Terriglobia bacterium]
AVKRSIAWVYGAAVGTHGSLMPVVPGQTACLECLFDNAPQIRQPTCDTAGVLNAVTSLIASLQVAEALKILAGRTEALQRRLVTIDAWSGERAALQADTPRSDCPTCGLRRFARLEARSVASARICGRDAVQVPARDRPVDLAALAHSLAPLGEVRSSELAVRFSCPPHALTVFSDGRAIVKGTQDLGLARSLYARYVGD